MTHGIGSLVLARFPLKYCAKRVCNDQNSHEGDCEWKDDVGGGRVVVKIVKSFFFSRELREELAAE